MVEGKPYRYGLIVAGLCVAAMGLFIMTQERPHVYATMCALGVTMVCVGTVWSLCQCYPKVQQIHCVCGLERKAGNNLKCVRAEAVPGFCGQKSRSCRLLSESLESQCHSCPTLPLV
uniref:Uncharacterized protein n=1 Tax=Sphaeramia orbicularis TaxID=375764 RepID=A0A673C947_9TELE